MNHRSIDRQSLLARLAGAAGLALAVILLVLLLFTSLLRAQEATQETVSEPPVQVKTWKIPDDLLKNLKDMVEEFNKRFQETIEIYKAGLKVTKAEFKEMPEDVVFDLQSGVFMKRKDFLRLQRDAQKQLEEQAKKDAEVKENEKKIN